MGRIAKDRATGKPLTLLDDITLVIRPREFVCILGPSGSGKSTLLSSLSGRATPDLGDILLNGRELYAHFEVMKQDIAVVPQKDVLHESLTVQQALWYTAKLRLPPDTTRAEIDTVLSELLETVGLTDAPQHAHPASQWRSGQARQPRKRDPLQAQPAFP